MTHALALIAGPPRRHTPGETRRQLRPGGRCGTRWAAEARPGNATPARRGWISFARLLAGVATLAMGLDSGAAQRPETSPPASPGYASFQGRPDRLIVRPKAGADRGTVLRLYAAFGCRVFQSFPRLRGIEVLQLRPGQDLSRIAFALEQSGLFHYAEPDQTGRALLSPNDPHYQAGDLWGLNNTGKDGGVAGADIMAAAAWSVLNDASSVVVAVVDSGVRHTHQDLAANMWVNPGESGLDALGRDKRTNGVDDDGNGYIDDVHGINVLTRSGDAGDDYGHGSHVAGTLGAVGNNGIGITGVAWRVRIMSCKFIDRDGTYTVSDAITSLEYARANGAKIVTAAWGNGTFTSAGLRDAVIALRDANIILVAAAGNDSRDNDPSPLYPASYDYSNVLAVAATDRMDARASFSNYGARSVHLGAPGASVLSCWSGWDTDYRTISGTSMAAAHVAGACALLWARFPAHSHQQIIQRILATVDPLPALAGKTVSGGRLNLAAALTSGDRPVITSAGTEAGTVGVPFTYQITASGSPTSFSATGLNAPGLNLSVNAATGAITGTPTVANTYQATITATNAIGGDTAALVITISAGAGPTISGITVPPSGSYRAGQVLPFTATYTAPVVVTGTPRLTLTIGSAARHANYTSGSGTASLTFSYVVAAGENDSDGIAFANSAIDLNGGTVRSASGANAILTFTAPAMTGIRVDTTAPAAPSITGIRDDTGTPGDGVTTDGTLLFEGTAEPNSTVSLTRVGVGVLGSVNAGASGGWVFDYSSTALAPGSYAFTATARDAAGNVSAASATFNVTVVPLSAIPVVTSATVHGTAGTALVPYQVIATNQPTAFAIAGGTLPAGISLHSETGIISGTPGGAANAAVTVSATNPAGTGSATINFVIAAAPAPPPPTPPPSPPLPPPPAPPPYIPPPPPAQTQTITFDSPVGPILVNEPVRLAGTASSGLPLTYSIVSGNAVFEGTQLILRDTNPVIVRATQPGNAQYRSATATATFRASKAPQQISVAPLQDQLATTRTVELQASASSGLPVGCTLVRGPASLAGTTLSLSGAAGVVTVVFSQPGNDAYEAAADVTASFNVRAVGEQVFFGTAGHEPFAAIVSQDNSRGTLLFRFAERDEAIVARFQLGADGSFSVPASGRSPLTDNGTRSISSGAVMPASREVTFTGRVEDGVMTVAVPELGASYTGKVQPPTGTTAALAGLYVASIPGSAAGDVHIAVGTTGEAYALLPVAEGVSSGMGRVLPDGTVNITAPAGTLSAQLHSGRGTVTGTLVAAGVSRPLLGLADHRDRTDRLVNLSSRLRISADEPASVAVAGFVISGDNPKAVLVRAVGPGLTVFNVQDVLAKPRLQLFDHAGTAIADNAGGSHADDVNAAAERVGAFPLHAGSDDAAVLITLAPGPYTAVVSAASGGGVALLEVYDAGAGSTVTPQRLLNLSARGFAGLGDARLVAGFVVTGNAPKRVLIRGIGPSLAPFGVEGALADPALQIFPGGGAEVIAQNDDWGTPQPIHAAQIAASADQIAAAAISAGAFALPRGSRDAAVLVVLPPGSYTAVLGGAAATTGSALVEVYEIAAP